MTEREAGFYGTEAPDREAADGDRGTEPARDPEPPPEGYDATAAAPADAPGGTAPAREATGEPEGSRARVETRAVEEPDATEPTSAPLFPPEEAESLRGRWDSIQTEFVDEPRAAVEQADDLVGDVMQRLADGFSHERTRLEKEWDRGDGVSTEDLRVALKRYRSFFDRLLSV